jgi:hypothetical protein
VMQRRCTAVSGWSGISSLFQQTLSCATEFAVEPIFMHEVCKLMNSLSLLFLSVSEERNKITDVPHMKKQ